MKRSFQVFILLLILAACAPNPAAAPSVPPPIVSVYASPDAEPWLEDVYACAEELSIVIRLSASESAADIRLRLGQAANLATPAYQVGSEDILVVARSDSPLQSLTTAEARALFSQRQESVEIWVSASGADAQEIFEREVMHGSRIHTSARLAPYPSSMLEAVNAGNAAVGLLPRRWKGAALRELFALRDVPVLAITLVEPRGAVAEVIACLQEK